MVGYAHHDRVQAMHGHRPRADSELWDHSRVCARLSHQPSVQCLSLRR